MLNRHRPARRTIFVLPFLMMALVVTVSAVELHQAPPAPPEPPAVEPVEPPAVAPVVMVPAEPAAPAREPGPVAASAPPAPTAPAVPTAPALAPVPTVSPTGFRGTISRHDGNYTRVGFQGGDYVVEKHDDGFRFSIRIEAPEDVEFSSDGLEVLEIGHRSRIILRTSTRDISQRLEIRPDRNGNLRYEWMVDGVERPFDAAAREWMTLALEVARGMAEASEMRSRESSMRGEINPRYHQLRRKSESLH